MAPLFGKLARPSGLLDAIAASAPATSCRANVPTDPTGALAFIVAKSRAWLLNRLSALAGDDAPAVALSMASFAAQNAAFDASTGRIAAPAGASRPAVEMTSPDPRKPRTVMEQTSTVLRMAVTLLIQV